MSQETNSGLLAVGSAGKWSVDILEEAKGKILFFTIVVHHPLMVLQFSTQDLSVLTELTRFLGKKSGGKDADGCFTVDSSLGKYIYFIASEGRLSVRIRGHGDLGRDDLFEVMFSKSDQKHLAAALRDARNDI